ncbi:MAG: hypothetical protein QOH96_3000 [Blastocatellia bacterium]|nr:hypothetical protein [Blastocatellia bacterium]
MKRIYFILLIVAVTIVGMGVWLWWNRPQHSDMAEYVPLNCLAFAEIESIPMLLETLGSNEHWNEVFPGLKKATSPGNRAIREFAARTGIGPSEIVVLGRAQVAVALFGIETQDVEQTLTIKPHVAVIINTHSWEFRTKEVVEKLVGDFAVRTYRNPEIHRYVSDGATWTEWIANDNERRIITAVVDNVAVIANDASAIKACLAIRSNADSSMSKSEDLVRARSGSLKPDTLAFGFVTPAGTSKLIAIVARSYSPGLSDQPAAQSAAASLLPAISDRLTGSLSWTARTAANRIEDVYLFRFSRELDRSGDNLFTIPDKSDFAFGQFVPQDANSFSSYSLQNPVNAWRGLKLAVNARLDTTSSIFVSRLMEMILEPYGISTPEKFLQYVDRNLATVRFADDDSASLAIVKVADELHLHDLVVTGLGVRPLVKKDGDVTLFSSSKDDRSAAFVEGYLLLGSESSIKRCLDARKAGATLADKPGFLRFVESQSGERENAVSISKEPGFFGILTGASDSRTQSENPGNQANLDSALQTGAYSESRTTLSINGFVRKSSSNYGLFGRLASEFAGFPR